MALFALITGARDNVIVSLRWQWELPVTMGNCPGTDLVVAGC
jgi:hypothetical protein